jgi:hypothetical protein
MHFGLPLQPIYHNREHQKHQSQQQVHLQLGLQPAQQGLEVERKKIYLLAQLASRNSCQLFCLIYAIVIFFIYATIILRNGPNTLNPVAFLFHFSSFFLVPLTIIWQNQNLKSYAFASASEILKKNLFIFSYFNSKNQIYPIAD